MLAIWKIWNVGFLRKDHDDGNEIDDCAVFLLLVGDVELVDVRRLICRLCC